MATTGITGPAWDKELLIQLQQDIKKKLEKDTKPTPEVEVKQEVKVEYKDNEKPFSEVFGIKSHSGIEHAMPVFKPEDWHPSVRAHIPKVDEDYIFPPQETEEVAVGVVAGDRVLVFGPKGSGKSVLGQQICARLGIPWIRVNCRADMESSALFGCVTVENGTMKWVPGPMEELGRYGGMIQIDEGSVMPAGIAMSTQWAMEKKGEARIYLADKPGSSDEKYIIPHDWFRIVMTDNTQLQGDTTGRYAGTQPQNEALLDRFSTTVRLGYMPKTKEVEAILSRVDGLDKATASKMVDFATHVRKDYDKGNIGFNMSLRGLIEWGAKAAYWKDIKRGATLVFLNKLVDGDRKVVEEVFFKMFGK